MSTDVIKFPRVPVWNFGDRIRKIRREAGLGQEEFAKRIGCNGRQLGQWESGRNNPSDVVAVAKAIRQEFGVPTSWTLGTDDEKNPQPEGPDGGEVVRREGIEPPTR